MPFSADLDAWPLVRLRIEGKLDGDEITDWVQLTTVELPGRKESYVVIIDLLAARMPSVEFVREQATGQTEAKDEIRAHCGGIAFVLDSPVVRGALKAILHIAPLPTAQLVTSAPQEAEVWANSRLLSRAS